MEDSTQFFENNLISLAEVNTWSLESLKDYCRKRGCKVSGTRAELCASVYYMYNHKIPEKPGVREEEMSKKIDYKTLFNAGCSSPDPHKLKAWVNEKDGMGTWPPLSYIEIVKFITKHGHSLSADALTSYKTGKGFSYFYNDWLQEVWYHNINKSSSACYLKSQCIPSNRLNDPPHNIWIKVVKKTGEILSAYCSCVAGLSQTCNHSAALMFKIESAYRLDVSNPACTTGACSWKAPSSKKATFMALKDMKFKKPDFKKGKSLPIGTSKVHPGPILDCTKEVLLEENIEQGPFDNFVKELKTELPTAVLFLPGKLKRSAPGQSSTTSAEEDIIQLTDQELDWGVEISNAAKQCSSADDLIAEMTLSATTIAEIERKTIGQSSNELWSRVRRGRITASNFYRVFTKVETLKKNPSSSCSSLISSLLYPPMLGHLPQIQKGLTHEKPAIAKLIGMLTEQGHSNVTVSECGIYIDATRPYLGASPDGIVCCTCCPQHLLEIKCPTKKISELAYLSSVGLLKPNSHYFAQIQGQMMITSISKCYFFIFYSESMTKLEVIDLDKTYCHKLTANLEVFFRQFLAPTILANKRLKT